MTIVLINFIFISIFYRQCVIELLWFGSAWITEEKTLQCRAILYLGLLQGRASLDRYGGGMNLEKAQWSCESQHTQSLSSYRPRYHQHHVVKDGNRFITSSFLFFYQHCGTHYYHRGMANTRRKVWLSQHLFTNWSLNLISARRLAGKKPRLHVPFIHGWFAYEWTNSLGHHLNGVHEQRERWWVYTNPNL